MGNYLGRTPAEPAPASLLDKDWRPFSFLPIKKQEMIDEVRSFKISNPKVQYLRILVHGPIGAGKSSFINSIDSIFQGRMAQGALANAMVSPSFTKKLYTPKIKDGKSGMFLPFVISDIMGLENRTAAGAHIDDIISALEGHLKDGHRFNPESPIEEGDPGYKTSSTLSDKVHCLVSVLPADTISFMPDAKADDVINKLREIRRRASDLRIPQVIVMTKVDYACPIVSENLEMIYRSKIIRDKMHDCSNKLGIPMNAVFPVKNYHEEIDLDNNMDILLLSALKNILNFADDHVGEQVCK